MKYCCVYLPDGTASLASVRPGHSIRDMLAGICEKRGFSLPDIKVYLVGNEQVGQAAGRGGSCQPDCPPAGTTCHSACSLLMVWLLQKALVLDQECSVLADQEVKLENRISFE